MSNRIRFEQSVGKIHFWIKSGDDGPEVDVELSQIPLQTVDPSLFQMPSLPANVRPFDIGTQDPNYSQKALWDESSGLLIVSSEGAGPRSFSGSLPECVLEAYDKGAFA